MKLGVVVIHYNTSEDLERCLVSLGHAAPACGHAVMVVDNASSDPGLDGVRERFPQVRWQMNAENVGYSRAVNQGLEALGAEYTLILNPDIVVQPGSLDALLGVADAHPRAGIVAPQLLNEDGTIQDSCRRFYTLRTMIMRRTALGKILRNDRSVDEHLMRDFVLARHAGMEHSRVVAAESYGHAMREQPRQRMIGQPLHRAGALVADRAHFQSDIAAPQLFH